MGCFSKATNIEGGLDNHHVAYFQHPNRDASGFFNVSVGASLRLPLALFPSIAVCPSTLFCSPPFSAELHPERTLTNRRASTNSAAPDASSVERVDVESGTTSIGNNIAAFYHSAAMSNPANGAFAVERRGMERGGVFKIGFETPAALVWEGITHRRAFFPC